MLQNDEISYWCVYKIVLIYNVFLKIHMHCVCIYIPELSIMLYNLFVMTTTIIIIINMALYYAIPSWMCFHSFLS